MKSRKSRGQRKNQPSKEDIDCNTPEKAAKIKELAENIQSQLRDQLNSFSSAAIGSLVSRRPEFQVKLPAIIDNESDMQIDESDFSSSEYICNLYLVQRL